VAQPIERRLSEVERSLRELRLDLGHLAEDVRRLTDGDAGAAAGAGGRTAADRESMPRFPRALPQPATSPQAQEELHDIVKSAMGELERLARLASEGLESASAERIVGLRQRTEHFFAGSAIPTASGGGCSGGGLSQEPLAAAMLSPAKSAPRLSVPAVAPSPHVSAPVPTPAPRVLAPVATAAAEFGRGPSLGFSGGGGLQHGRTPCSLSARSLESLLPKQGSGGGLGEAFGEAAEVLGALGAQLPGPTLLDCSFTKGGATSLVGGFSEGAPAARMDTAASLEATTREFMGVDAGDAHERASMGPLSQRGGAAMDVAGRDRMT